MTDLGAFLLDDAWTVTLFGGPGDGRMLPDRVLGTYLELVVGSTVYRYRLFIVERGRIIAAFEQVMP